MEITEVLIKPLITEKTMKDASLGKYAFKVHVNATKEDIKRAVASQFKVTVLKVKTVIVKGKSRRAGRRRKEMQLSPWKKATVKLGPEQKIDLFEVSK